MLATIFFICYICIKPSLSLEDNPIIRTTYGDIQGFTDYSASGDKVHKFFGVPYARPPIGNLRFKKPRRHRGWHGKILDATQFGNACIQTSLPPQIQARFPAGVEESEDCLNLHIYVPDLESTTSNALSVMVYIHDGVFIWGTSSMYDGTLMATKGNIIVVVINYRLDMLGWISSGDDIIRGNYGFFDQRAALRWIKANIAQFNGDPELITIFGESAGAESVMAHILSGKSHGLFSRAIVQSATAPLLYPYTSDQRQPFLDFANHVGCFEDGDTRAIVRCLRRLNATDLRSSEYAATFPNLNSDLMFRVVDGRFLKDQPRNILKSGKFNDVDLIIGFNSHEANVVIRLGIDPFGISFTNTMFNGFPQIPGQPPNLFLLLTAESALNFQSSTKPYIVGTRRTNPNFDLMFNMVLHEYDINAPRSPGEQLQVAFDVLTRSIFAGYATLVANTMSPIANTNTFTYQFSHRTTESLPALPQFDGAVVDVGAFHSDELFYLFPFDDAEFSDPIDLAIREALITGWTTFAKTGQPMINDTVVWPAYDTDTRQFWNFTAKDGGVGEPITNVFGRDFNFWYNTIATIAELHPICSDN